MPIDALTLHEAMSQASGLLCSALFPVDTGLLDAAPNLRVISNFGVGFDNVDVIEATRRGIAVCNTPGVLSEAVADLTMALVLAAARRTSENAQFVASGAWSRREPPPPLGFDLGGKTLGIIGFGRIGQAVARRALAFGMNILFQDVVDDPRAGFDMCTQCEIEDLLVQSDIVSVHANLSPQTHHLLGPEQFRQMKPTAWLVNTARGPIIDQAALVDALREGTIAGAALDVLELEPPPATDPILSLPNVILLPHVGSATIETRAAMLEMALSNLIAVLSGRPPPSCVNPEVLAGHDIRSEGPP
jgi:glyoxylate reductase